MYRFLDEFSISTLEQACELLAQPLFDGFLVPNDCAECAITLLGDIANSSEHRGNAEGALAFALRGCDAFSVSSRGSLFVRRDGVFHTLALETMERQQKTETPIRTTRTRRMRRRETKSSPAVRRA